MADGRTREVNQNFLDPDNASYAKNGHSVISEEEYLRPENDNNSFDPPWAGSVGERGDVFYLETAPQHAKEGEEGSLTNGEGFNGSIRNGQKVTKKKRKSTKRNHLANSQVPLQSHGVTFNDVPTGVTKEVTLVVDPTRHNFGRRATLCESLFGLIPGHFNVRQSGSNGSPDNRIMVQGLLPAGEASRCGIKIGEWLMSINGYEVDSENIDSFLSAIQGPMEVTLTLQKIAIQTSPKPVIVKKNNVINNNLVKLVSGERLHEEALSLEGVPHGVLYLTMDCNSEDMRGKEDVLYQFPSQDSKLVDVRGMFITLGHMLVDVTNSTAKNSTLLVNDQLVHAGYSKENREIMVLSLPANKVSIVQLHMILEDSVRILKVLFGSLHSAFSKPDNHPRLDHFYALLFQRFLLAEDLLKRETRQTEYLEPFIDLLPGVRTLTIPEESKVIVNNCLSEFEAAEFCDMSDSYYNLRRSYTILGTCLYYKGYLLANHLHKEDLVDVNLYLTYYCLLTLCNEEQIGSVVIWKEIFPTRRCFKQVDPLLPGYTEPEARWFLLVIGMKNALIGVLLEAGGCASWAEGCPSPDPFFVDQAKATLLQMNHLDVFNQCEIRLQSPSIPSLACTDWFLPSHKMKDDQSQSGSLLKTQNSPKVNTGPSKKPVQPESILKKRTSSESHRPGRTGYEMDSDGDSMSTGTSEGSTPVMGRRGRKASAGSEESAESGSSSNMFKGSRKRRNLLSVFDVTDMKRGLHDCTEEGSFVKLTSGCDNTLFQYIHFDLGEGVLVCPSQQELLQVTTALHKQVLRNFHNACFSIRKLFQHSIKVKEFSENGSSTKFGVDESLSKVTEEGVLFHCTPEPHHSKKTPPSLSYWVIGRLMWNPTPQEFYVCFHDSVQQNIVEMAFKLGFGVVI